MIGKSSRQSQWKNDFNKKLICHNLNGNLQKSGVFLSSFDFFFDERKFAAGLSGNGSIFLCATNQVRHDFFDWTIRKIFGDVVTQISEFETDVVAHPK